MTRQVLVETFETPNFMLLEGREPGRRLVVEGTVGWCDRETSNGRIYTRPVMEREITKLQERITARSLFASVDHPPDGKGKIRDTGAICVGLRVEADGRVVGRYEVVEGTGAGSDLAAVIRAGGNPGMSSRGVGSTEINMEGKQVVKEDFRLYGYDFVVDPACGVAYPKVVAESVDPTAITPAQLRAQFPAAVGQIEEHARIQAQAVLDEDYRQRLADNTSDVRDGLATELRAQLRKEMTDDFAVRLVRVLQQQRVQVEEVVRSELLADPTVAGAKKTLEDIANLLQPYSPAGRRLFVDDRTEQPNTGTLVGAQVAQSDEIAQLKRRLAEAEESAQAVLAEKEAEIARARDLQERALGKAREFAHKLFVERALMGRDDADSVRQMIGDPTAYKTIEDLQSGVAVAIEAAESAQAEADDRANAVVQVERHKADIARQRIEAADETVAAVRERAADKLQEMSSRFESVLRERDAALEAALQEVSRLRSSLQESSSRATMAQMMAFADRRSIGHPRRADIMAAVQSGRVVTEDQVNQLAAEWDIQAEEPGGVAERIRRSMSHGREAPTEHERVRMELTESAGQAAVNGLGASMEEIRQLAGIGNSNRSRRY